MTAFNFFVLWLEISKHFSFKSKSCHFSCLSKHDIFTTLHDLIRNCVCQVNITRDGCGTSKLCVEIPADCDPTGNSTCLFGSAESLSSTNATFELRGNSTGYIALGLTANATMVTYIHTQTVVPLVTWILYFSGNRGGASAPITYRSNNVNH